MAGQPPFGPRPPRPDRAAHARAVRARDLRAAVEVRRGVTRAARTHERAALSACGWVTVALQLAELATPTPAASVASSMGPMVTVADGTITIWLRGTDAARTMTQHDLPLTDVPLDELPGAVERFIERMIALIEWGEGS